MYSYIWSIGEYYFRSLSVWIDVSKINENIYKNSYNSIYNPKTSNSVNKLWTKLTPQQKVQTLPISLKPTRVQPIRWFEFYA
jgi:hypothetical protein